MKLFLHIISILWLTAGTFFLIFPKKTKTFYSKLAEMVKLIKFTFILSLVAAWLFFWAAPASSLSTIIKIFGILSLIKGLFILLAPINMLKSTFNYLLSRSLRCWRLYGVFIILLGAVVGWSVLWA